MAVSILMFSSKVQSSAMLGNLLPNFLVSSMTAFILVSASVCNLSSCLRCLSLSKLSLSCSRLVFTVELFDIDGLTCGDC